MADERNNGRRVAGTLLIVVGALLLLGRLDLPEPWHLHGLWPLVIIALGVARFWTARAERRGAGLGLVFAGGILLLHTQHVLHLRYSWPLFIVGAGVSILVSAWGGGERPSQGSPS
jgi:hypothetical protein